MTTSIFTLPSRVSSLRMNIFQLRISGRPVNARSSMIEGETVANVNFSDRTEHMRGADLLGDVATGWLGKKGDYTGNNSLAKVSGLWTCAGLIIASKTGNGPSFDKFIAAHFGGIQTAWEAGFKLDGPAKIGQELGTWVNRSNLFAVAIAGPNHPRCNLDFVRQCKDLCNAFGVQELVLIWTAASGTYKDRPELLKERIANPSGHGKKVSLALSRCGLISVKRCP